MTTSHPNHPFLVPTTSSAPLPGADTSPTELQFQLREAVLAGDRPRIDHIGTRLLQAGGRAERTNHQRLILAVAAARVAPTQDVAAPGDLPGYWTAFGPTIVMLQLEVELSRGSGSLTASFRAAQDWVMGAHDEAVAGTSATNQAPQIARLSAVRDLPAASRLAWHGVDLTATAPALYGEAKLNAELRHHHSKEAAYQRGLAAMEKNPRWAATLNTFAATARELGRKPEAVDAVARSMVLVPNTYAGNTMWKIGKELRFPALFDLGNFIHRLASEGAPEDQRRQIAVKALTQAGLRASVEKALDVPAHATRSLTSGDRFALRNLADRTAFAGV